MIRLRQDVSQPTGCYPAKAEPLPSAMDGKALFQQFWDSHSFLVRHQQRRVIYSFSRYGKFLSHIGSLPQFPKLV